MRSCGCSSRYARIAWMCFRYRVEGVVRSAGRSVIYIYVLRVFLHTNPTLVLDCFAPGIRSSFEDLQTNTEKFCTAVQAHGRWLCILQPWNELRGAVVLWLNVAYAVGLIQKILIQVRNMRRPPHHDIRHGEVSHTQAHRFGKESL